MVGRRPKSPTLAILDPSTNRSKPAALDMPDDEPEMPRGLSRESQTEWKRTTDALRHMGILSSADRSGLTCYIGTWERVREAEKQLAKDGMTVSNTRGQVKKHPCVQIVESGRKELRMWLSEFGLTPASRSRVARATKSSTGGKLAKFLRS